MPTGWIGWVVNVGGATGAKAHAAEVLRREPAFTVESYLAALHYRHEADCEHRR